MRTIAPALIIAALAVVACATAPEPTVLLTEAEVTLDQAIAADAAEHAPIELRFAREKLSGARLAVENRDHERAARLAQQSIINSELAVAKTAAARARDLVRRQETANEALRAELGDGS